jgi:hypothetical protein
MKQDHNSNIRRRELLRVAFTGAGATAASVLLPEQVAAWAVDMGYKRRARYQANSVIRDPRPRGQGNRIWI